MGAGSARRRPGSSVQHTHRLVSGVDVHEHIDTAGDLVAGRALIGEPVTGSLRRRLVPGRGDEAPGRTCMRPCTRAADSRSAGLITAAVAVLDDHGVLRF
jgi:hypothetical protein